MKILPDIIFYSSVTINSLYLQYLIMVIVKRIIVVIIIIMVIVIIIKNLGGNADMLR